MFSFIDGGFNRDRRRLRDSKKEKIKVIKISEIPLKITVKNLIAVSVALLAVFAFIGIAPTRAQTTIPFPKTTPKVPITPAPKTVAPKPVDAKIVLEKIEIFCYERALFFAAAYFTLTPEQLLTKKIENFKHISEGHTLVLNKDDAIGKDGDKYIFKVGYLVAIRSIGGSAIKFIYLTPEFTNRFRIGDTVINEHKVKITQKESFKAPGYTTAQRVAANIPLSPGENVITLSLDDDDQVFKPDEMKTVFKFTIIVEP